MDITLQRPKLVPGIDIASLPPALKTILFQRIHYIAHEPFREVLSTVHKPYSIIINEDRNESRIEHDCCKITFRILTDDSPLGFSVNVNVSYTVNQTVMTLSGYYHLNENGYTDNIDTPLLTVKDRIALLAN